MRVDVEDWCFSSACRLIIPANRAGSLVDRSNIVSKSGRDRYTFVVGRERLTASILKRLLTHNSITWTCARRKAVVLVALDHGSLGLDAPIQRFDFMGQTLELILGEDNKASLAVCFTTDLQSWSGRSRCQADKADNANELTKLHIPIR
jgi:hypothetical protein